MREQTPDCLIDRSAAERVQRDQRASCVFMIMRLPHAPFASGYLLLIRGAEPGWWVQRGRPLFVAA
jgi:hypothetical protein